MRIETQAIEPAAELLALHGTGHLAGGFDRLFQTGPRRVPVALNGQRSRLVTRDIERLCRGKGFRGLHHLHETQRDPGGGLSLQCAVRVLLSLE